MWIVRLALNKPYTFIVAAIVIVILGFSSVATTPTDIFPNIDIPQITVIWSYSGLPAKEMEQRITTFSEFVMRKRGQPELCNFSSATSESRFGHPSSTHRFRREF